MKYKSNETNERKKEFDRQFAMAQKMVAAELKQNPKQLLEGPQLNYVVYLS